MSAAAPFPALPLMDDPPSPAGWHQVRAPGGYEAWRFEADDAAGEYRFSAELVEGCSGHGGYHAAYRAFRSHPTRVMPPAPAQWPCVHCRIERGNQTIANIVAPHAGSEFSASTENCAVSIGKSRATPQADGSIRLTISGNAGRVAAELDFTPLGLPDAPAQLSLFPRAIGPLATPTRWGGQHWWLALMPRCTVHGTLTPHAEPKRFDGYGLVDRVLGTAPAGQGLKRIMRGRVLLPDRTLAFALAVHSASRRTVAHLLDAGASSKSMRTVAALAEWDGRTALQMRYPATVALDQGKLVLRDPTIIAAEPHLLRLVYSTSAGATALCEIVYPRRLAWEAVGRLLISNG